MKTKNYTPHVFALCAIAVLQPIYTVNNLWFVSTTAVLSAAILLFLSSLIKLGTKNNLALYFAAAFSCIAAIYGATASFIDYIKFLKTVQLPQTNIILLCVCFAAVIAVFATSEGHAFYKYCLAVGVAVAVIITICFIGGIKNFDFSLFKDGLETPKFPFAYFLRQGAFVASIPLFIFTQNQHLPTKTLFGGVLAGFIFLAVCTIQGVLTLGGANFDYPYLSAVSVISSSDLFTRLDGLVYFVAFTCATINTTICVATLKKIIKNFVFARKVQLS